MKNLVEGLKDGFRAVFYAVGIGIPLLVFMLAIMHMCKWLNGVI